MQSYFALWLKEQKERRQWEQHKPAVSPFKAPMLGQFSQAQEQGITQNDFSTSHQYLARYGLSNRPHF